MKTTRFHTWLFIAALLLVASAVHADGTWTMAPTNPETGGQAFGLWMLTDGRVLSHGKALSDWVILTPDRKGSYAKGSWKKVASGPHARGGACQHILRDGRFFQAGGEYVDGPACTPDLCKGVEIYDPQKDEWKTAASGLYDIADTGSTTLKDGKLLFSTRMSNKTEIYDPDTDKWTASTPLALQNGDENSWAALQNGGILAVGYAKDGAAIYDPATQKWQRTGPVPSGWDTGDTGGISLMFDGRVLVYGFGQMYIYTPGPTAADPGTWALGPKALMGDRAEDEYSNTMPFGKVWGGLVEKTYGPGVVLQEFDPVTNTVTSVKPAPDKGNPYPIDYVNLPNGEVMITAEQADWIYTPDETQQPKDEWRPTVGMVTYNASTKTYTLTGTQITGLINGADEGDDMTMAQNYPIVWLKNEAGDVYYARTFNFSSMVPSVGPEPETCDFVLPTDLPDGEYELYVSAVGVRSKDPYPLTPGHDGMPRTTPTTTGPQAGSGGTIGETPATGDAGRESQGDGPVAGRTAANGGVLVSNSGGSPAAGQAGSGAGKPTQGAATAATSDRAPDMPKNSGCGCYVVAGATPERGWASLAMLGFTAYFVRRRARARARA